MKQPKEPGKNFYEMKRQVVIAMRGLLNRDGQFHIERTVSFLCLETGLSCKSINGIVSNLLSSGELVIKGNLAIQINKIKNEGCDKQ